MRSHGLASVLAGHPCAEGHSQRQEWIGKRPYAQRSDPDEEDYAPYESPLCVPSLAQHQERDGDLVGRGQQPEQGRSKGGDVLEEPPVEWDYGIVGAQRDELVGGDKDQHDVDPYGHDQEEVPQEDAPRVGPEHAQDEHQQAQYRRSDQLLHYVLTSFQAAIPNLTR